MRRIPTILVGALLLASPAIAATYEDGHGREWRQVVETTGLTWTQIAQVCPQDGASACSAAIGGRDLSRWIWATQVQVMDLMNEFLPDDPALPNQGQLSVAYPGVGGMAYWFLAQSFPFTPTFSFTMQGAPYTSSTSTTGWTSTRAASGNAILGIVGFGNSSVSIDGGFSVSATASPSGQPVTPTGVWLWRPIGPDYSPPVIAPNVDGMLGSNGWYVAPVTLSWSVEDPDSNITEAVGCEGVTLGADTDSASFTCTAMSAGGTSSASVTIAIDGSSPTVTCGSNVFQLGQPFAQVSATVADSSSGPQAANVFAYANTSAPGSFSAQLAAMDRAGNQTAIVCPYSVKAPTCHGLTPTRYGTGASDSIQGTSGRDVIHALHGNDVIDGAGGDDVICGGEGNDDISGGVGDDDLDGGLGSDSIRGDDGDDNCVSGEIRMSSCASNEPYHGSANACGFGAELALVLLALGRARRRSGLG